MFQTDKTVTRYGVFQFGNNKNFFDPFKSSQFSYVILRNIDAKIHDFKKIIFLISFNFGDVSKSYIEYVNKIKNIIQNLLNKKYTGEIIFICKDENSKLKLISRAMNVFVRTLNLEYPQLNLKVITVDGHTLQSGVFLKELNNKSMSKIVRYVNSIRYELKIKTANILNETDIKELDFQEGSYVITGGTSGIGLEAAKMLAQKNNSKIILISRYPEKHRDSLNNLTKNSKSEIIIEKCDVSDFVRLKKIIYKHNKIVKIKGIIHAAGITNDKNFLEQEDKDIEILAHAKIFGSWNLHQITMDLKLELDYFILFSSIVGSVGNVSQLNHGLVNVFMDQLALYRANNNLPGLSVAWGAWSSVGTLKKNEKVTNYLKNIGFGFIPNVNGIRVLELAMKQKLNGHFIYAPMDWCKYALNYNLSNVSFYSELVKNCNQLDDKKNSKTKLSELSTTRKIINVTSELFKIPSSKICEKTNFFDLGMDSLMAVQFRNRIQSTMQIKLGVNICYKHPTVEKLSKFIKCKNDNVVEKNTHKTIMNSLNDVPISMQQRRWLKLVDKGYGRLLIPVIFETSLDQKKFYNAAIRLIDHYPILRYVFNSNTTAKVEETNKILLSQDEFFVDLKGIRKNEQKRIITKIVSDMRKNVPNPRKKPSWSLRCVDLEDKKFILLLSIQHLVFDGVSISVFISQLAKLYANPNTFEMKTSYYYLDYTKNQMSYRKSLQFKEDLKLFEKYYSNMHELTCLPNHPAERQTICEPSACLTLEKGKEFWKNIEHIAKIHQISIFTILASAYAKLISEIVGNSQVSIGTIVSNRPEYDHEEVIGPFVQPFPFYADTNENIISIFKQIHAAVSLINEKSNMPIVDLIENVEKFIDLKEDTYFTDAFIMLNNYQKEDSPNEFNVRVIESLGPTNGSDLPNFTPHKLNEIAGLFLVIDQIDSGTRFNFWYHISRFPEKEVSNWANRYLEILKEIIVEADIKFH